MLQKATLETLNKLKENLIKFRNFCDRLLYKSKAFPLKKSNL